MIEDDEGTRPALVHALEAMGHTVFSASTADGGREELQRLGGNVDVVVCDVQLPDANGRELSLALGRVWSKPRFVLISGYSPDFEGHEAVYQRRFRWLSKPFTMAELAAVL